MGLNVQSGEFHKTTIECNMKKGDWVLSKKILLCDKSTELFVTYGNEPIFLAKYFNCDALFGMEPTRILI